VSEPGVGAHEANGDHTNRAEGASSPTIETRSPTPGIVVVGFVLSVLGLTVLAPLAVPGLIVSIVARRTVKRLRAAGGGLALAGIVCGAVGLVALPFWIYLVSLYVHVFSQMTPVK